MKSTIEDVNSVQKRVRVELTEEMVDSAFTAMFQDIRTKATVKGFRKGKAPMNMIRRMYGDMVASDVFQKLIRDNLFGAIETNKLKPVASPVIETSEMPVQGKPYAFSALVDVMPALNIEGYKDLSVTVEKLEANDSIIEDELKYMQRSKAKTKPVEDGTAVKEGHLITMSHTAQKDGKDIAEMSVKDASVEIGAKQLLEDLESGFIGMKVGDSKTVTVKLPENYGDKDLANQSLDFTISVSDVKELTLPPLDDEFAKDMNVDSMDELRSSLKERITQSFDQMKRKQLESSLMEQIAEKNNFEVPPSIVDQVIDSMIGEMGWKTESEKKEALANAELRNKYREDAKKRAQNTLTLLDIAEKESIQVTDDDIDQHIRGMIPSTGDEVKPEFLEQMKASIAPQLRENLIFDKTLNFIIENAKVAEIEKS